jgi:hypothetical protein
MRLKTLITGLIILTTINLSAQSTLSFERVIKTDSVGRAKLFSTINDWVASNYNSAQDVIQMADKDAGIIIGKGTMKYFFKNLSSYNGYINYTIKVYIKDNRYKVILTNFYHTGLSLNLGLITSADIYTTKGPYKNSKNKVWKDIKLKIKHYSNDIINSLDNKTKGISNKDKENDW